MLSTILREYAVYLQVEKGIAEPTQRSYLGAAECLLSVAQQHPRRLHLPPRWQPAQLDKRALEIYFNHLREERGWAPATLAHHASALRAFFGFLQSRGHIERNPARHLHPTLPRRDDRPPEGGEDTVRNLFTPPSGRLRDAREQLLLELCYGAALRPAVIYAVRALRVLARAGALRITTPRETLEVPLAADGIARAQHYLELRKAAVKGLRKPPFWVTERGTACTEEALARQIRRAMERVGLSGGPTVLRQLAARHFAERGGDTRSVQALLRARSLGRLDRYAPPDFQSVLRQFRQAHPRQQAGD